MKVLHLLRHAKSSWAQPDLPDRERVLNKRGRLAAPRMGRALAARMEPMPIHVSPARRAQLTLQGLCDAWPALAEADHITDEALYTFSSEDLLAWLALRADDLGEIFLIGHNPALTWLINGLVGEVALENLPTAGYARLELAVSRWADIQPGCAVLQDLILPRNLERTDD